jgi:hypothetical protein
MISYDISNTSEHPTPGLENDILKVLLYFDVFRFPLTVSEIYRFLPSNSITPAHVLAALDSPSLRGKVQSKNDLFYLTTAAGGYAEERREKELRAARMMSIARVMAKIICMFPYVRGVFLSGELSKGIASKKSDIDFVIVTKERRLWLARTLLILFKKVFLLNRKRFFCVNQLITEDHLRVEIRNVYSATEVATLLPLENDAMFSRYMHANFWITQFFPNWRIDESLLRTDREDTNTVRSVLEWIIPDSIADDLDRWFMLKWQRLWKMRYPDLDDEERNRKFQCSEYLSTAYGEDYQEPVLDAFGLRLREYDAA